MGALLRHSRRWLSAGERTGERTTNTNRGRSFNFRRVPAGARQKPPLQESKAYQAASVLKEASAEGRIDLHAVAVVQRMEDGMLRVKEGDADDFPVGTWTGGVLGGTTGGIVGLTLGTLGGPLGLLLGGAYGALLGSLIDLDTAKEAESVLATMARAIEPGKTALIAHVTEPAVEVVDGEIEGLGELP